ncbi:MAG: hypothetical protein Q8O68_00685 [Candidatus Daviesbacteria bacterium]|nr:hypothetical protein [Candidatus Daviesbacteria bacterium]
MGENKKTKGEIMALQKIFNKPWWKSKTLWVGVLQIGGGTILTLSDQMATGGVLTLSGVVQVVLRAVTNSGIDLPSFTLK